jgi:hypothetical protein
MSMSLDFQIILDQASLLVNGLWPVFLVPIGVALGLALVMWIVGGVKRGVGQDD